MVGTSSKSVSGKAIEAMEHSLFLLLGNDNVYQLFSWAVESIAI